MQVSARGRRFAAHRSLPALLALIAALVFAFAGHCSAADSTKAPDTPMAQAAAASPAPASGLHALWSRAIIYVRTQQRDLHRQLAGAIKALRTDGSATAAWSLILLSFLYGVFHAAGPGHGKAVISTYLLTHRSAVRRGIWLSAVAALTQGLTAIVLVLVLVALIGWKRSDAQAAVGTMETVSYGLIALVGIGLAGRALWALTRAVLPAAMVAITSAGALHHSEPAGAPGCGHSHAPDPSQLSQPLSLKTLGAIVLSIGIRPCSGAVLVLLFAEVLDLRWAGISAVLAMSFGTAVTVAALAVLAVNFRRLAGLLAGDGRYFALAGQALALLGGGIITALGATLFFGSLGAQHPLL
jgi:nickel/cobalt transporter (NicO) family protein